MNTTTAPCGQPSKARFPQAPVCGTHGERMRSNGATRWRCRGWVRSKKDRVLEWGLRYVAGADTPRCATCGISNADAIEKTDLRLQFDHIDPETKEFEIPRAWAYSGLRLRRELDKCQLLCAPCHRQKSGIERRAQTIAAKEVVLGDPEALLELADTTREVEIL